MMPRFGSGAGVCGLRDTRLQTTRANGRPRLRGAAARANHLPPTHLGSPSCSPLSCRLCLPVPRYHVVSPPIHGRKWFGFHSGVVADKGTPPGGGQVFLGRACGAFFDARMASVYPSGRTQSIG